jgi:DNA-binding XRE family transcriptional regulator
MAKEIKIHTRLPMLRSERGLSRKEMADILGIHYQTIGYIERGEYMPALDIALRTAAYFDLPVEAIFSLEPFPSLTAEMLKPASSA